MIIYLFGIACAGKSYLGELLALRHGFKFYNADSWISADHLAEYCLHGEFSQSTRDVIHQSIAEKIANFDRAEDIVIAQASIKECNRQQIMRLNPDITMLWVKADLSTLLARAARRNDYICAEKIKTMYTNFDVPQGALIIDNSSNAKPLEEQLLTNVFYTNIS